MSFVTLSAVSILIDIFHIGKFCFWVPFFKQLLHRNYVADFVEICNICVRKVIIEAAKRIINFDKVCHSYSDLNFGVTFLERSVYRPCSSFIEIRASPSQNHFLDASVHCKQHGNQQTLELNNTWKWFLRGKMADVYSDNRHRLASAGMHCTCDHWFDFSSVSNSG